MPVRPALAPLLCLVLLAPARAQEPVPPPELTPEAIDRALDEAWFGLYIQGQKCGFGRQGASRAEEGGQPVVIGRLEFTVRLVAMGERIELSNAQELVYSALPPYPLLRARSVTREGDEETVVALERGETGVELVQRAAGAERRLAVGELAVSLADELAVQLWVARPDLAVGATMRRGVLDLDGGEVLEERVTLIEERDTVVQGVRARLRRLRSVQTPGGEMGSSLHDPEGRLLSAVIQEIMELRREPEEQARQIEWGADLFVSGLVRIDRPLGEGQDLRRLTVRAEGPGAASLRDGPGQQVREEADGARVLIVEPAAAPVPASEEERARYLRATPETPADDPTIRRLAAEATAGAADERERVARLLRFVSEYVEDALGANALSTLEVIRARKGDCTEHAALFTALCRAAGIPCREASGFMYMGDEELAFGAHAWNEVVLDGVWVPVDPTWDQLPVDATHIRMGDEDQDQLGAVLGRLTFRLVSADRR